MGVADVNPGERAARITFRLMQGARLDTDDVARMCNVSRRTAQRDFVSIERVLPVRRDDRGRIFIIGRE